MGEENGENCEMDGKWKFLFFSFSFCFQGSRTWEKDNEGKNLSNWIQSFYTSFPFSFLSSTNITLNSLYAIHPFNAIPFEHMQWKYSTIHEYPEVSEQAIRMNRWMDEWTGKYIIECT